MRLIDTRTLELSESFGDKIPKRYVILSHTWEDEEVTFQDWQDLSVARKKKGFFKISMACKQAQKHDLDYLWVDTNCIDKTSSSELSEAINSMFSWYQQATICYAYLSDVRPMPPEWDKMTDDYVQEFCQSKWFTRGWTLQELLAPVDLTFYSRDWSKIASRRTMAGFISQTTEIKQQYLLNNSLLNGYPLKKASVAEKMSWVSRRVTTRIEDIAYCMLGIFDINMPLLYGEGSKSFTRLQEEIIRPSNDHTIFCWTWTDLVPPGWVSLLAPCPQVFRNSGNFVSEDTHIVSKITFKMTNAGLSITLPIIQTWSYYLGVLNAWTRHARMDFVPRLVCVPIEGRLDTQQTRLMKRIPFPPSPVYVYAPWVLCQSRLYIKSIPDSTFIRGQLPPSDSPHVPLHSFLLAFDNVEEFVDDPRSLEMIRSKHFNEICQCFLESAKDFIWTEVYPPEAFDHSKSCIMLSVEPSSSGALIRLGRNAQSRVLFIGVVLRAGRPYRFCGIIPKSIVRESRSAPELLNRVLKVAREKEENCDVSWGYGIGLTMGEAVFADSGMISVIYVTCEREHVGLYGLRPRWADDDARSDIAVAEGSGGKSSRNPCRLFSSGDY